MIKALWLLLAAFALSVALFAAGDGSQRRALVIGIDKYNPDLSSVRWQNLDGCVNDAISIKEVLQARYGFNGNDITILKNHEASREIILKEFDNLLKNSSTGDIAVIYYAGHGSQVRNSASSEADKKDESIVPADSYKGALDIRDKELARIFNQFADKGIVLSVIFDCCHSGSIGRGTLSGNPPKLRYLQPDESIDSNDPSSSEPPENKGVLLISASQDFELASEQRDADGNPHGAFTIALLQSLKSLPSTSSVSDIFASVRAILKYNGKKQEPVLAATEVRKRQTLFGIDKASLSGKTLIAVIQNNGSSITLQGGIALGIYPNSIVSRSDPKGKIWQIKVISNEGLNRCTGSLVSGDIAGINPGDLFELKTWCLPENSALRVFIPQSAINYDQLVSVSVLQKKLTETGKYIFIDHLSLNEPLYTLFFDNSNWFTNKPDGELVNLGAQLNEKQIIQNIPEGSSIFISLPPTNEVYQKLIDKFVTANAVNPVPISSNAQYFLSGRWVNGILQYAFIMPQISVQDSSFNNTMPVRTDYFSMKNNLQTLDLFADSLSEAALKLSKIHAWLNLASPPDDGSFPYSLKLQNYNTKEIVLPNQTVRNGDILRFLLATDTANLQEWDGSKRYIYVFSIDSKGTMQLIYPLSGSVENRMPLVDASGSPLLQMKLGNAKIKVTEPFGVDTYIMLATNEPIPNPDVFNQISVISRGDASSGLQNLLNIGSRTRGELITPSDWGIQKVSIRSVPN